MLHAVIGFLASASVALAVTESFAPDDVELLPSKFAENRARGEQWLRSLDPESLTHAFRVTAGVWSGKEGGYRTVRKLGGWESLDCDLRGHTTGHVLSALAWIGEKELSAAIIDSLAECQQENGYLSAFPEELIRRNIRGERVWAPWYTLHKILQGLLDQARLRGNAKALDMASRMGDWAHEVTKDLDGTVRARMLRNEFGGFNDAMFQLYRLTRKESHLQVARFFYHDDKIDPLKSGNADLGTAHANTFIPKLAGEAQNFELFGDERSRTAAELLFRTLTADHAFATGEVSDREHLFDPSQQAQHLSAYDGENCCTFNLWKLGNHLLGWSGEASVADYIERAKYNHILGQQDPESSMVTYFTPLETGAYRLYSTTNDSYWCCVGSGFECQARYNDSIFRHDDGTLYVDEFIPSRLKWRGTRVTMESEWPLDGSVRTNDFPRTTTVRLSFDGAPRTFKVKVRRPHWATAMDVAEDADGTMRITFGLEVRKEFAKGSDSRYALLYGPIVLARPLEAIGNPFSDPHSYNDYYTYDYGTTEAHRATGRADPLSGPLVPFHSIHHRRYIVYWEK